MKLGADRALADLLGGFDGGWLFYRAALEALVRTVEQARGREQAFCSYPQGEFGRLVGTVEDALELAVTAVQVQLFLNDEPDGRDADRRETIAAVLLERAEAAKAARL